MTCFDLTILIIRFSKPRSSPSVTRCSGCGRQFESTDRRFGPTGLLRLVTRLPSYL